MLKLILFEVTENNFVPNFASVLLLSQSRIKIKYKLVKWIFRKCVCTSKYWTFFKLPPQMCTPHLVMEPVMGFYHGPHYEMEVAKDYYGQYTQKENYKPHTTIVNAKTI